MSHQPDHCHQMITSIRVGEKNKGKDFRLLQGEGRRENLFLVKKNFFSLEIKFQKTFQGCLFSFFGWREGVCPSLSWRGHKLLPLGGLLAASRANRLSAGHWGAPALQRRSGWVYGSQGCCFLGLKLCSFRTTLEKELLV